VLAAGSQDSGCPSRVANERLPEFRRLPRTSIEEILMSPSEARNIEVVRRYFDGCNSGDIDDLMSTLAPDVSHYFLPSTFPPIKGALHLAKYWRKYKLALDPTWAIDRIIAQRDEVVSEWSCIWHVPDTRMRLMARGSEWYVMRDARILEVRAYFIASPDTSIELATFPYAERGYLLM
jgi:ketosteroid isomerase-like protein